MVVEDIDARELRWRTMALFSLDLRFGWAIHVVQEVEDDGVVLAGSEIWLGDSCCSGGEVVNEERVLIFNNKFNRVFFFSIQCCCCWVIYVPSSFSRIILVLNFLELFTKTTDDTNTS
jgi:hypothetical protein